MLTIIEMPSLSSTMRKGKVLKWHKREGDFVEKGETLFEVQTDKVSVEVDSLVSGFLRKILLREGIEVAVNAPIAIIGDNMEEDISSVVEAKPSAGIPPGEKEPEEVEPGIPRRDEAETEGEKRIKISPLAKRIAEEEGIEIEALKGTGPGGRITKEDVERAKAERTQRQPIPGKAEPLGKPLGKPQPEVEAYEEIELTPMRRVIARRLQESKATAPHFYVDVTADASALKQLRDTLWRKMEKEGAKITFNDILVKIASQALKESPMVNASFLGDRIRLHKAIHIGVAVAVEDGLIVPVVRNADQKSILQISREVMELAGKARNKRLLPHEYEGGTFTITNMGMFGVETFHAILNPPESAILSVGAIISKPVVVDDQMTMRPCMKLSLSVDHRVVDGALASRFIVRIKELVEAPLLMLA
jgi:pyruvate dehydrogenase E2 component (dihydrolipoamide acetyltransferase)